MTKVVTISNYFCGWRRYSAVVIGLVAAHLLGCENAEPPPGDSERMVNLLEDTRQSTPNEHPSPGDRASNPDGHSRMVNLLEDISQSTPNEHRYLGNGSIPAIRADLAKLPGKQPSPERIRLLTSLGVEELRFGQNERAIEHLEQAYNLLPKVGSPISENLEQTVIRQLAVANLRMGETENCVHCNTSESCLFPIRGKGVHEKPQSSRNAIRYYEILLAKDAQNMTARWLLNVAYMTIGEYPQAVPKKYLIPPEAFESDEKFPRFVNIATELGLNTFSLSGGTIVDDFNDDGYLDLMTSTWNTSGQIRCFLNNGNGTFTERTKESNLIGLYGGLNLIQADYDNDGDVDVLVLRGAWLGKDGKHPNSLLKNDGRGRFRDVTFDVGLGDNHYPTQTAAWADYDNDGDLDLYVGNDSFPNQLFENDGHGQFTDVAKRAGVAHGGMAKGVVWGDYNDDRLPDLYVSNLDGPNQLYQNNGNGTLTDVSFRVSVERPFRSLPAWFWDFNNDGVLDIYVASYSTDAGHLAADYLRLPYDAPFDCLYQGIGNGRFREVGAKMNLRRATQPMGSNFGDVDNDGFPDFYLGTGAPSYEKLMPNLFFHNQRGEKFTDVTTAAGLGHLQKGHGVAFADFDHDGDQDIFIELGGAYPGDKFGNALFENPGFGNNWIAIKLIGKQSNRSAIGARVRAEIEETETESKSASRRSVYKWVNSGGSFGASPLRLEIGLGRATRIAVLEVFWPTTGRTQRFYDVPVNQFIEITEGTQTQKRRETVEFRRGGSPSIPFSRSPEDGRDNR
jgi:hypothetical protein